MFKARTVRDRKELISSMLAVIAFMIWEGTTSMEEGCELHVHEYVPQPEQRTWLKLIKSAP